MGNRYDHRTDVARAADAAEPEVIDQPIEPGAVGLRDEAPLRGATASSVLAPLSQL